MLFDDGGKFLDLRHHLSQTVLSVAEEHPCREAIDELEGQTGAQVEGQLAFSEESKCAKRQISMLGRHMPVSEVVTPPELAADGADLVKMSKEERINRSKSYLFPEC